MRALKSTGLFSCLALVVACEAKVTTVDVQPATASLTEESGPTAFTATPKDASGKAVAKKAVTWESSDPKVATVDANGQVAAVGSGTAQITAKSDTVSGAATVNVQLITQAKLAPIGPLEVGAPPAQLALTYANERGEPATREGWTPTYMVRDPAIATVDATGMVTAVAAGETVLTAKVGNLSAETTLSVTAPPPPPAEAVPAPTAP